MRGIFLGYVLGKQENGDQLGVVSLQFCFVSDSAADMVSMNSTDNMESRSRFIIKCKFPAMSSSMLALIQSFKIILKRSLPKKMNGRALERQKEPWISMSLLGCYIFPKIILIQHMSEERAWNGVNSSLTEGATHSLCRCF